MAMHNSYLIVAHYDADAIHLTISFTFIPYYSFVHCS